ncbi:MAG: gliding motility-associated ABC transporter ATP-binding subunit GldA [bacterium]|nr:MAG: gliding motility-associated ABC transporter ATP-binding subunit GldA [bacterium]
MAEISIQNISKFYGDQKVLDNVHLEVDKGQVVGLLGPNGAGKTTLMKILTSYLPPNDGTAFIQGLNVQTEALKIRKLVGYLPENNPLYPEMYVREYLGFVLKMYNAGLPLKKRVDEVIELTGLKPEQHKKIGALSKGYRHRVGLAQALIHDPPVLILDEPTTGLDPNQLTGIRSVISALGKEKAILLSTHIMQEVEAVCDRVVIIHKGNVVADDEVELISRKGASSNSYRLELKEKVPTESFRQIPGVAFAETLSETKWILHAENEEDIREQIFKFAVSNGLNILSLSKNKEKMEDIFHQLTKDTTR